MISRGKGRAGALLLGHPTPHLKGPEFYCQYGSKSEGLQSTVKEVPSRKEVVRSATHSQARRIPKQAGQQLAKQAFVEEIGGGD